MSNDLYQTISTNYHFGPGFYCTESDELAKEWAVSSLRDGFSNRYTLDTEYLSVLRLNSPEYTILNWIAVLVEHRLFSVKTPVAGRAKRYLIDNFSVNVNAFDVITGYRADDSYFDYAVNTCNISGNDFVKMFVISSVSKRMENGEPAYLAGKSGIEITREIVAETKELELVVEPQENFERSKEYWIGWAIAYYQWHSERKYSDIFEVVAFDDLQKMYYTLHEADITKFADIMDLHRQSWRSAPALVCVPFKCTNNGIRILTKQVQIQHIALLRHLAVQWKT